MRRFFIAAAALFALAVAAPVADPAQAMTLPGSLAGDLAAASGTVEVRLVCEQVWNGFYWARSCYETRPRPRYYSRRIVRPRAYYRRY